MRRKDREISDPGEMLAILKDCDCCRLGLTDGNEAYILPLNFGISGEGDDLTLYFHCAKEGKKIDLIKKSRYASFEADTDHVLVKGGNPCCFSFLYKSVMGRGEISLVEDVDEKILGMTKIMEHYADEEFPEIQAPMIERVCILKLDVTEWSCKAHA